VSKSGDRVIARDRVIKRKTVALRSLHSFVFQRFFLILIRVHPRQSAVSFSGFPITRAMTAMTRDYGDP